MEKSLMIAPKTGFPAASFSTTGFRCAGFKGGNCARSVPARNTRAMPTASATTTADLTERVRRPPGRDEFGITHLLFGRGAHWRRGRRPPGQAGLSPAVG